MPVMVGKVLNGGVMHSASGSGPAPGNPVFQNLTAANTNNFKKAITDVAGGLGSRHIAFCGNSTKAGTGSNGTAFGTPTGIAAARRLIAQGSLWAALLAAKYGITVSIDNFWGDAGWNTPFSNITTFDPRVTGTGAPTFSSSIFGPGGRALTTTDATSTITFTPSSGRQFSSITIFYAGTGNAINVKGDQDATTHPTTTNTLNQNFKQTITFSAPCNSVTFTGAAAAGMRLYGGYVETAGLICLHVQNMGWSGSVSSQWAQTATVTASPSAIVNLLAPRACMFSEDINDPNTGIAIATHQANIQTFLNAVKSATCDPICYLDHWTASSDVDGASGHATLAYLTQSYAASVAAALAVGAPVIRSDLNYISYANQHSVLNYMWDVSHMLGQTAGPTIGQVDQATNVLMPFTAAALAA